MNKKYNKWTESEIDWLKINYPIFGPLYCGEKLGRKTHLVALEASLLKLDYVNTKNEKKCSMCKEIKQFTLFKKDKKGQDGLSSRCKQCRSILGKKEYQKTREKQLQRSKEWQLNNPEKNKARQKKYYLENSEKLKLRAKNYYEANKEKCKLSHKEYKRNNREKINSYYRERRKTDIQFRLAGNLRNRICSLLRGEKSKTTLELLGCSLEFLKKNLESQFEPGMSWENYGKWEIDHFLPCASFDLTDIEQQKKCFNWKNLMPRWATNEIARFYNSSQMGNSEKRDKILNEIFLSLFRYN